MSLNFSDENGQYKGDDYKVYSTNIRIDHKVNNWLSAGVNMQASYVIRIRRMPVWKVHCVLCLWEGLTMIR